MKPIVWSFCLLFSFAIVVSIAQAETLVIQPGPEEGKDTMYGTVYYQNGQPTLGHMHIGGWADEFFSFIEFDLSELPNNAVVENATLSLYQNSGERNTNEVELQIIIEEWSEESITLSNNPNVMDSGLGWISIPDGIGWWEVEISPIVKNWINLEYENFGLKLDARYTSNKHDRTFYTSDYAGNDELRPKLTIEYTLPEPPPPPDKTPEELVAELEEVVSTQVEQKSTQNSYFAHIKKLLKFFEKEQFEAFLNQINALTKKVTGDVQKQQVSEETAEEIESITTELEELPAEVSASDVPLITQIASPYPPESTSWANDVYAGGIDPACPTIAACGCALASMSMVAQSYGMLTDIDGQEVNPRNMNTWLTHNNGYLPNGSVKWTSILQYLGEEKGNGYVSHLSLAGHNITDMSVIDAFLADGAPVVAYNDEVFDSGGHYFVLTQKNSDDSYDVRDPYWYLTQTTDDVAAQHVQDYANHITKANLFAYHKNKKLVSNIMELYLASPAELLAIDSAGRKTGYDPEVGAVVQEIPGSSYNQSENVQGASGTSNPHIGKRLIITNTQDSVYTVQVIGTGEGPYMLSAQTVGSDGTFTSEDTEHSTTNNQVDEYIIDMTVGDGELGDIIASLYEAAENLSPEDKEKIVRMLQVIEDKVEKSNTVAAESKTANLLAYIAKKDITDSLELTTLLEELLASL